MNSLKKHRKHLPHQSQCNNDLPFNGPSQWYNYRCLSCDYSAWVEDIIVDAFPPGKNSSFPIILCPECGNDFVCDTSVPFQTLFFRTKNHSKVLFIPSIICAYAYYGVCQPFLIKLKFLKHQDNSATPLHNPVARC